MAFREVKATATIESLFEDEKPKPVPRATTTVQTLSLPFVSQWLSSLRLPLPSLEALLGRTRTSASSFQEPPRTHFTPGTITLVIAGLALVWFGAGTTGTFYGPAAGKFTGILATVFYQYQLGTMLEFGGILVLYNQIRKFF